MSKSKELVVISGKGGTGKTSITACFAALEKKSVTADCDVDAADLHLVLQPKIIDRGDFSGGVKAKIDLKKCTSCGRCRQACRFSAIEVKDNKFFIDPLLCEGCGVCKLVCPSEAVILNEEVNGEWYVSETRFGPMSHAKLGIAEENTGKLVVLVRQKAEGLTGNEGLKRISDGAPGTGCPVIASLTGVDYAVIVTEPTVSGLHDLERILDLTQHFNIKSGIIVNKSDINIEMTKKIQDLAKARSIEVLGSLIYDEDFTKAQMQGRSLVEYINNDTTEQIKNIWLNLQRFSI